MKTKSQLDQIILIYINYLLPKQRFDFSYEDLQNIIYKLTKKAFSIGTLRKELSILKKSGLVTTKLRYRKPVPILTLEGKLAISTTLAYKKFGPWDKKWRVVICNIPKSDNSYQARFQAEMYKIGYKKLGKNAFISPHPLLSTAKRIASNYALEHNCTFIEAEKIESQMHAIEKTWKIAEIDKLYKVFISNSKRALKAKKTELWPFVAKQLEGQFADLYNLDPHLPEELLPKNYHGPEAYFTYKKILNSY